MVKKKRAKLFWLDEQKPKVHKIVGRKDGKENERNAKLGKTNEEGDAERRVFLIVYNKPIDDEINSPPAQEVP